MLAEETSSSRAASSKMRELPCPSPRSAFRSMVSGKQLFFVLFLAVLLADLLAVLHRLGLDYLPRLRIVLESPAGYPGKELLSHHHRGQPVGVSIIRFDWKPRELRSHPLVPDLAIRIPPTLPLHGAFLSIRLLHAIFETFHP